MKLYTADIVTPWLYASDHVEWPKQYVEATRPFLDSPHFEVRPFEELTTAHRYPVEVITQVWTADELLELSTRGIQYNNVKLAKTVPDWPSEKAPAATPSKDDYFNARVNVHVPGMGLLAINTVKVVEDYCTDALQGWLLEGWRILAVAPQPDQRRPDYILGRYEPKD